MRGRGRTGARCRDLSWPVSPARPPQRTCESPRIRRSTGSRWLCGPGWDARPGGGDAGAPVEVPCDRNRLWPEHLGVAILYLPAVQNTALQRSPVQAPVPFTEPADYPPPCEVFEVAEGRRRHAVPEVAAPAAFLRGGPLRRRLDPRVLCSSEADRENVSACDRCGATSWRGVSSVVWPWC